MSQNDPSSFGTALADVTRLLRREFDRRAAHLGLTRVQWRVLKRIGQDQGMTQAELAETLELDPIAIGRVIDRLHKAGFVDRRRDPADRRCWRLHLAPGSAMVMDGVERISRELRHDVLGEIPAQDMEITLRVLDGVKESLLKMDRDERADAQRRDIRHDQ
jgi:DNA-binding MarR family transcriptional regulator